MRKIMPEPECITNSKLVTTSTKSFALIRKELIKIMPSFYEMNNLSAGSEGVPLPNLMRICTTVHKIPLPTHNIPGEV